MALPSLVLALAGASFGQDSSKSSFPAGSEKAVEAVRQLGPGAVVSEVSLPKDFGAGTEDGSPLFWVVNLRRDGIDQQLKITPEGTIILLPQTVDEKDLPRAIADAIAREVGGGKVLRCEKQEARATLRYVALVKPMVHYVVQLAKDGERKRLDVAADGRVRSSHDLGSAKEATEETPSAKDAATTDAEIPADAAKAVAAVKAILPKMVFKGVEEVGYLDGTGDLEVLNYEVEFFLDGEPREWNATPDGIVIQVPTEIDAETLPAAVRQTLARETGWETRKIVKEETRAGLKFVPLEKAKVVYLAEMNKDGQPTKVRFHLDGSRIDEIDPKALLGRK
jgi:hypothetical protein